MQQLCQSTGVLLQTPCKSCGSILMLIRIMTTLRTRVCAQQPLLIRMIMSLRTQPLLLLYAALSNSGQHRASSAHGTGGQPELCSVSKYQRMQPVEV